MLARRATHSKIAVKETNLAQTLVSKPASCPSNGKDGTHGCPCIADVDCDSSSCTGTIADTYPRMQCMEGQMAIPLYAGS